MTVAQPEQTAAVIAEFTDHPDVGADVVQAAAWTRGVIADVVNRERAKRSFEGFVDPTEIDRIFDLWRDSFPA